MRRRAPAAAGLPRCIGSLCAGLLTLLPACVLAAMMGMDDASPLGRVLVDQLEWREAGGAAAADWDAEGWYGGDYNKLWARSEGDWPGGVGARGRVELLWDRIATRWWSVQGGARYDSGGGAGKGWAALGIQGLAPYWIDIEATAYVGSAGALAARFKAETDLRLTQRLVLQPECELNAYSRPDPERRQAAGLSDVDAGLRLRYEIRRELAPYFGLAWTRRPAEGVPLLRDAGAPADQWQWLLGIRAWY
jgi:copper resistance protein B